MGQNSSASEFIENILIILSNLPPGFRNGIIKKRLDEFNGFDQSEKKEIINNILKNYGKIEKTKVLDLFNSWLTSLTEMDNSSINSIFYSYLLELHLNPRELEAFDSRFVLSLVKVLNDMPKNKRDKLWYCFMEAVFNTPNPKKFIKLLPNYESNVK